MIILTKGSIFESGAEVLVNPVNCVGVMGKGLALEFKKRYPANFKVYRAICDKGELKPGGALINQVSEGTNPMHIANIATKDHWKDNSKLKWIKQGLSGLVKFINDEGIKSVAIPAIGCGLSGLDWGDVYPYMEYYLGLVNNVDFYIYPPK